MAKTLFIRQDEKLSILPYDTLNLVLEDGKIIIQTSSISHDYVFDSTKIDMEEEIRKWLIGEDQTLQLTMDGRKIISCDIF